MEKLYGEFVKCIIKGEQHQSLPFCKLHTAYIMHA